MLRGENNCFKSGNMVRIPHAWKRFFGCGHKITNFICCFYWFLFYIQNSKVSIGVILVSYFSVILESLRVTTVAKIL